MVTATEVIVTVVTVVTAAEVIAAVVTATEVIATVEEILIQVIDRVINHFLHKIVVDFVVFCKTKAKEPQGHEGVWAQ